MSRSPYRAAAEARVNAWPSSTAAHAPVILLVEDNEADADLTREALAGSRQGAECHVVSSGTEALACLRSHTVHAGRALPHLILLDLNLPGLDGRALLGEIKCDPTLRHIPVVVLSSSSAPEDIRAAYRLQANAYVTKPLALAQYFATIRAIERFWLSVATLPPGTPTGPAT